MLSYAGILIKIFIVIIAILVLKRIVCHFIDRLFKNQFTKALSAHEAVDLEEKRLHTLAKLFKSIASYVLYFIGIITCLDMVGFSVMTIVAGAGVVSLAVAFGAQSIVQDLMSGIFIVLENQYAVGEYVQIDAVQGRVKEIGMKTTKVETDEGHLMIIANGSIGKVVNYSRAAQRGYADVGIAYEEDLDRAIEVMQQACDRVAARWQDDLEEQPVVVGVTALADSAVTIRATFTAWHWKHFAIERELRKELKNALEEADIEISYSKIQIITQ